jgi:hypothetical protein
MKYLAFVSFLVFSFFGLIGSSFDETSFSPAYVSKYSESITQIVDMVLQDGYSHGMSQLNEEERKQVLAKIISDEEIKEFFIQFMIKKVNLEKEYSSLLVFSERAESLKNNSLISFVLFSSLLNLYFGDLLSFERSRQLIVKNSLIFGSLVSGVFFLISGFFENQYKEKKKYFSENVEFLAVKEDESTINHLLITKIISVVNQVVDARE